MRKARYKRSKVGDMPGDCSMGIKIAMLEDRLSDERNRAKAYRKEHHKIANRRFRHNAMKEIYDESHGPSLDARK